jgi:predicted PurR-regulated permease PerM
VEKRFEIYTQLAAAIILVAGCYLVLRPFMAAILFAAVVCVSTWPQYLWLLGKLKNRQALSALTMTLSLVLVIILPLALVAYNLTDDVTAFYDAIKQSMEAGPPEPPAWLTGVPLLGGPIEEYWRNIASSKAEMLALAKSLLEPTKNFLLASGIILGQGVLEMSLAAFISFFFYRDGEALIQSAGVAMDRLAGLHAAKILDITNGTVRNVTYGLLGTALAQGLVAAIGFAIAGVPAVMLLGLATAVLSLIPVGPPLIWGGAAIWLFQQGNTGWSIFMLLWGVFLISGVDNVVKPLLISRGSRLPFLLVLLGVMGGVLAFGFVGIFIGPTLLAVGFSLLRKWTSADSTTTG